MQLILTLPFFILLLMIATGPLLYANFWHKHYKKVCVGFSLFIAFSFFIKDRHLYHSVHALAEYIQFIALISSLYIITGGIYIKMNFQPSTIKNVIFLFVGAVISNLIGTTGASVLLIRPFIILNRERLKPYHIVFFIFMVSNIGGALTPIGDPPLFIGFIKGVPFFWTIKNLFLPWITALALLSFVFYILDSKNKASEKISRVSTEKLIDIKGKNSILVLLIVIGSIFVDPNIFEFVPSLSIHGHELSFLREIIMISLAIFSYKTVDKKILKLNEFSFEPIKEIIFLFLGIFLTLIPVIDIASTLSKDPEINKFLNKTGLFWITGSLSAFLDNAPTYLNFLAASMSSNNMDINKISDVKNFANGVGNYNFLLNLKAISISAVFFGAMTYIGNGPNMLVKSVSENFKIKMPNFFDYILKYSIIILLPVLVIIWFIYIK